MTSRIQHQLVTLKRAVRRDGIICRLRVDEGTVRIDIFWKPPRYKRNLARFVGAMPLSLIIDLRRVGFASLGAESAPIDGLFETGIMWASLASSKGHAEQVARSVLAGYGMNDTDQGVAWAPSSLNISDQAEAPALDEQLDPLLVHSGPLAGYYFLTLSHL